MDLLLLSSSRAGNSDYLETAQNAIYTHLSDCTNIVFVPYAGVTMSYNDYTKKVQNALPELSIKGLHEWEQPLEGIQQADAILVGGGNTFHLLHCLYQFNLVNSIREKVKLSMKYVGWSAGSNVAGNSIRTTNDMPIIEPESFTALALVPFQINPHFTDYQPPGHNGETRAERLAEFMVVNPEMPILAIPEGVGLKASQGNYSLVGEGESFVFKAGEQKVVANDAMLAELLAC
ncbi:dipeptidase PepE [Alteromonas sp. a30]|uniref:dipeptidase PepE n=1 Tax=Alteromonas sp. a30 TaxID=2730917 RepID=UPI0022822472|nr:dipeptidase PepE [Alteromonas sp. a30]MCY7293999.1 dipeptidase PepE [Alteromonas sp. a30]